MDKKEIFGPILIAGLSLIFIFVSFAVFITNGKSKKWVARKIKIGGILLTLSSVACNNGSERVSCYETVATNSIWMDAQGEKGIVINLDTNNILTGSINAIQGTDFSFSLNNEQNKKVQTGLMFPTDGKFDAFNETFKIEIDKNTTPGTYQLKLYPGSVKSQDSINPQNQVKVLIKKDD